MANPEHLEILKKGVQAWNEWRSEHIDVTRPDFSHAALYGANLRFADLHGADFSFANLGLARAHGVNLHSASLRGANLSVAELTRADLRGADFSRADLNRTQFDHAQLYGADFSGANLSVAMFTNADLRSANFSGVDLSEAGLSYADIRAANLSNADLHDADLRGADLSHADLSGTDFSLVYFGDTTFGVNDLSQVKGLNGIFHFGSSIIGIDTIYKSHGKIPGEFLLGCGIPESFIVQIAALVAALAPIQFYSCFISYSSTDQELAERLHADLQAKGVRVWFAPHDLPIGARIRPAIDESIRVYDKLLLVLSEHSVSSQWVEQEVETALAREREQEGRTVLFPVRIDDAVIESRAGWPALLKNTRNVGDFTDWKDHDSYQKAFDRLLRDLQAKA